MRSWWRLRLEVDFCVVELPNRPFGSPRHVGPVEQKLDGMPLAIALQEELAERMREQLLLSNPGPAPERTKRPTSSVGPTPVIHSAMQSQLRARLSRSGYPMLHGQIHSSRWPVKFRSSWKTLMKFR